MPITEVIAGLPAPGQSLRKRDAIQAYLGIIAGLLIARWTGRKPTLRAHEKICHYFSGP